LTTRPSQRFAASGRGLSNEGVRRLLATYQGRYSAVAPDFKFQPGMLYTQVRAISARINQNYDAWPSAELKKSYRSFIGKPCFVNHQNEDPSLARGRVVAARYIEKGADKYIEVVQEIDAKRFPKLAKEIRSGGLDSVSMGVEAGFTICSVCENRATDPDDMCSHILLHKGETMRNKKTGKKTLVYENCFKLGFFELSYVFDPADETAVVSRVIAASRTAGQETAEFPWSGPAGSAHDEARTSDGHLLRIYSPQNRVSPVPGVEPKPAQWEWTHEKSHPSHNSHMDSPIGEVVNHGVAANPDHARQQAERSYLTEAEAQRLGADEWNPDNDWHNLFRVGGPRIKGVRTAETYHGEGDVEKKSGPFAGPNGSFPVGTPKDKADAKAVCNMPSVKSKHPGTCEKVDKMSRWFVADNLFDAVEAPEDIDTLRDETEDDTDAFHHWVESPPELRAPDMDKTKRLDRAQEDDGLDKDRHSEDAEAYGADGPEDLLGEEADILHDEVHFLDDEQDEDDGAVLPINPPAQRNSRRKSNRGAFMSRTYRYAADEDDDFGGDDEGYDDDGGEDTGGEAEDFGAEPEGDEDTGGSEDSSGDIHDLLDEAEQDIEAFEDQEMGGGDEYADEGDEGDFGGGQEAEDGGPPWSDGDEPEEEGGEEEATGDTPPQFEARYRNVTRKSSRRNRRSTGGAMSGSTLSQRGRVASRRQHFAGDEGYTDGGVHGNYDGSGADESQGAQEEVYISQVPSAEAVVAPTDGDPQISNSPGNLVARKRPQFDPNHYQRLADVVRSLPQAQRRAMADKMVRMFTADNGRFNAVTFYKEAGIKLVKKGGRIFFAEDLTDPCEVDPALSGTDVQDVKGDDFESLALDDVETQPKDASIHAFRVFDSWLQKATGRTARQHGNANYIRRAAASYASRSKNPQARLASLFPTLEYILREARTVESREGNVRRYAEDTSLEVAAPQGRVDVEAPVKNVTDERAQSSQFPLDEFADNASDSLADPVLDVVDGNAGTWAPDKGKESRKLATGVEAVRLADAYIKAMPGTYKEADRWKLTAQFEALRQPVVRERIRLLEAVAEDARRHQAARKVATAGSRGTRALPRGLGSGQRTASTQRMAASDPTSDSMLFFG